jgi:hypothetical protein
MMQTVAVLSLLFAPASLYIVTVYTSIAYQCIAGVLDVVHRPELYKTPRALVRERTIPTERPPLVDEI